LEGKQLCFFTFIFYFYFVFVAPVSTPLSASLPCIIPIIPNVGIFFLKVQQATIKVFTYLGIAGYEKKTDYDMTGTPETSKG
jgi:hypothetical protein